MISAREKLAAAILRITEPTAHSPGMAPYFGAVLRGLVRKEVPGLGTIGVTKDGIMLWDAAFVEKTDVLLLAGVLIHEVMHVVLKHHERAAELGIVPTPTPDAAEDAFVANIAMDCAINTELIKSVKLPDEVVLPERLDPPLPTGKTFEEYYVLLKKQIQKERDEAKSGAGGGGDEEDKNDGKPGAGKGWCGSCAGHPMPGEPDGGKNEDGRSEAEMARFRKQVAEEIQATKDRGTIPASLQRFADDLLAPPRVDWRTKLARVLRGAVAYKSGQSDYTYGRMSRRQAGVGYGIGRPVIPALHSPVPRVAVGIDTSGSMSPADLVMALSEVSGVLAAVGAAVTVLVCDAAVHGAKECKNVNEAAALLHGGGGTSMTPIFDELETRKERPSVTIILTDGHIGNGHPAVEPSWTKTIWCVVGEQGNANCCPWGEKVHVTDGVA